MVDNAIPSQAVCVKTISNPKSVMSVASKVLQQMTVKLGGALWHVGRIPAKTMICGYDAYHEGKAKRK